jgi:hypothetical protein
MGGQKGIAIFCKYLGQQHELTAVSVMGNDDSLAENYDLTRLFSDSRVRYINPFYLSKIKKIIRERNIKNVITEHPYMAWMGWLLRNQLRVKWFVHSHNIEYQRFKTLGKWWFPFLRLYEKWAYSSADSVLFKTPQDIDYAVEHNMVKAANAFLVPYGIELKKMPEDIQQQKGEIYARHNIPAGCTVIFFNGALSYKPNTDALSFILDHINPLLLENKSFDYRILICGKDLPLSFNNLKDHAGKKVIYAGFVDDVVPYFKATDIFLNPIVTGGGVKTKIIDAMSFGATVVSCKTGAAGINLSVCGEKIKIVPDNDAPAFAGTIINSAKETTITPGSYYQYYYWGNIVKRLQPNFTN